jgi:rhamnosyltransferase
MKKKTMSVCVIIVLYNPDKKLLPAVIKGIAENAVRKIFLVDNSEMDNKALIDEIFLSLGYHNYKYIALRQNEGIAKAQNIGIKEKEIEEDDYIAFFDQDTIISSDLITDLLNGYTELAANDYKVGSVGPRIVDRRTGTTYRARIDKGTVSALSGSFTEVKQLISSGSLVNKQVLKEVGLMEESLFIDAVDFEWCWRAGQNGYKHFLIENAAIEHELGITEHRFGSIKISVPSAMRCYYLYRNYLLLLRRPYVPVYWKLSNGFKFVVKLFYYPLFLKNGSKYWSNIKRGLRDGIRKQV